MLPAHPAGACRVSGTLIQDSRGLHQRRLPCPPSCPQPDSCPVPLRAPGLQQQDQHCQSCPYTQPGGIRVKNLKPGNTPAALTPAGPEDGVEPRARQDEPRRLPVPPVRRAPQRLQPRVEPCQGDWMPNLNYQPREWLWIPGAPVICGRFFRSPPVTRTRRYLSSHPRTCGVLLLHTSGPCQLQCLAP